MSIDFLGLQAFLAIAEHGSFQRAAASLNLSSTALSHRLRKIEEDLGVQLIARTTRRVMLTGPGSDFLAQARRIYGDLNNTYEALKEAGKSDQALLAFGSLPTVSLYLIPPAITRFGARHPATKIKIADRIAPELAELVKTGAIEFALTVGTSLEPELELKSLAKARLVVFCPKGHPLCAKSTVTPADLEGYPLIHLGPRDGTRIQIEHAFGRRSNSLNWTCEIHQVVTAIRLVAAGAGLVVAPLFAADPKRDTDIVPLPLTGPSLTDTIGVLTRRDAALTPAAEEMIGIIRDLVRERLPGRRRK